MALILIFDARKDFFKNNNKLHKEYLFIYEIEYIQVLGVYKNKEGKWGFHFSSLL